MASSYADNVFDFDLNFLNSSTKSVESVSTFGSKVDKQRKAILIAKKKTIATDSLIRRYYEKKEILDQTERELVASKDECRKVCIDYKNVLEKYGNLEKENAQLRNTSFDLHSKYNLMQTQAEALQSHANQLQILVNKYENEIESLQEQPKVELTPVVEQKNKISAVKNVNDMLLRHIRLFIEVAVGKKNLNDLPKEILKRYEETIKENLVAVKKKKEMESKITDSTNLLQNGLENDKMSGHLENKQDYEKNARNGDCDEVASDDTGRGSSLAFSDSEKCFHSPEYFINDSPLNIYRTKPSQVSRGTSPISVPETVNTAVSPIMFETLTQESIEFHNEEIPRTKTHSKKQSKTSPIKETKLNVPIITFEKELSPIPNPNVLEVGDIITSPINFIDTCDEDFLQQSDNEEATNNDIVSNDKSLEKTCLELNNSDQTCADKIGDYEVEMILDVMRWKRKLITPIPATPAKTPRVDIAIDRNEVEIVPEDTSHKCNESQKIREENKVLHASIAHLAKEIMGIKSILKNKLFDDSATDIPDVINVPHHDLSNIIEVNKQINDHIVSIPPSPAPTEIIQGDGTLSDDDKPLEIPIQRTLVVEKDAQDEIAPSTEPQNDSTIHDRLQFEDGIALTFDDTPVEDNPESYDDTGPDLIICNFDESTYHEELANETCQKRKEKAKKLSRLEKMRQRLAPKSKICEAPVPLKHKNKLAVNQVVNNANKPKKVVLESDSSATLNEKEVYEKALKVMAELKCKQKNDEKTKTVLHKKVTNKTDSTNCDDNLSNKNLALAHNKNKTIHAEAVQGTNSHLKRLSPRKSINENVPDESENCPKKLRRRRGLKRNADHDDEEVRSKRVLRSSVRQSISESLPSDDDASACNESMLTSPVKTHASKPTDTSSKEVNNALVVIKENSILIEDLQNNNKQNNDRRNLESEASVLAKKRECENKVERNMQSDKIENSLATTKSYNQMNITKECESTRCVHPKESILCSMIEKHASQSGKRPQKAKDPLSKRVCDKITNSVAHIITLPPEKAKVAMDKLVVDLSSWKMKSFLSGLMKYLNNPERKVELFNKVIAPPAPSMTKSEQVVLYVIIELQKRNNWGSNVINSVLDSIEYILFQLNHSPHFDIIESMAHFYAVLCRYAKAKSRLRLFIMDAMYCIQFKSIPLIKQCLEVWMHILPLATMKLAESPLVTCLVYLLHFYKCEDKYNRVSGLRYILQKKYFFDVFEMNDQKILEMLRTSIKQLRDIPVEHKMMRMALIIVAKRLGARWCQENIIKKLLLPLIERENIPERCRQFCVSMLGPLIKPYPAEMKVHCEIIANQLLDMLEQNPSPLMEEAIFTSLIYITKHNTNRVIKALTTWSPNKISTQLEELLKDFVRSKPIKGWKHVLSNLPVD